MNEFTAFEISAHLFKPPQPKFKDLEAVVHSNIRSDTLPMQARVDLIHATNATTLAGIMLRFKHSDMHYAVDNQIAHAQINLLCLISTSAGRTVDWFEDEVASQLPAEMLQDSMARSEFYSKQVPLAPGTYRLNIVAKDLLGKTLNRYESKLVVPGYDEKSLGSSGVILADQLARVPSNIIGTGQFVIRTFKVRPRIDGIFKQSETMGIYAEFYHVGMDGHTKRPEGTVEYEFINHPDNKTVFAYSEDLADPRNFPAASSSFLVAVVKEYPLKSLPPGSYTLKITLEDKLKKQTLAPTAPFTVTTP